jgi:CRP-like cAMP-binding protein
MLEALANISWLKVDQLAKVAGAMTVTRHEKRSTIFSDKSSSESAYILLSGVARVTCDNRKGRRTMAILLSPGLIPEFPAALALVTFNFRCEAVTSCQVGAIGLNTFIKICLGIGSAEYKQMAASFLGRWDRVHVRCSNLVGCKLDERLMLTLLDLCENFGVPDKRGGMQLSVRLFRGDLADLVGASRARVTEHLLEFARKQLISWRGGHLTVDCKRLHALLMETHREGFSGELP